MAINTLLLKALAFAFLAHFVTSRRYASPYMAPDFMSEYDYSIYGGYGLYGYGEYGEYGTHAEEKDLMELEEMLIGTEPEEDEEEEMNHHVMKRSEKHPLTQGDVKRFFRMYREKHGEAKMSCGGAGLPPCDEGCTAHNVAMRVELKSEYESAYGICVPKGFNTTHLEDKIKTYINKGHVATDDKMYATNKEDVALFFRKYREEQGDENWGQTLGYADGLFCGSAGYAPCDEGCSPNNEAVNVNLGDDYEYESGIGICVPKGFNTTNLEYKINSYIIEKTEMKGEKTGSTGEEVTGTTGSGPSLSTSDSASGSGTAPISPTPSGGEETVPKSAAVHLFTGSVSMVLLVIGACIM